MHFLTFVTVPHRELPAYVDNSIVDEQLAPFDEDVIGIEHGLYDYYSVGWPGIFWDCPVARAVDVADPQHQRSAHIPSAFVHDGVAVVRVYRHRDDYDEPCPVSIMRVVGEEDYRSLWASALADAATRGMLIVAVDCHV